MFWMPLFDGVNDTDGAISISNVLDAPGADALGRTFGPSARKGRSGTLEFYLWRSDGELFFYETSPQTVADRIGNDVLTPDGELEAGKTYTGLLSEVLQAATGVPRNHIDFLSGYAWIVANVDGVAGTYSVTVFAVNFTQGFELRPAMGEVSGPDVSHYGAGRFGGLPLIVPDKQCGTTE